MKASETKFQPIIEGTKQYVVPLFQRAYSWDKKEWEILWDDLLFLCENEEPENHFIGSIVTMPTVSVPEGVAKYLLIDGQQRLTTIFVLLTLLRDAAKKKGDENLAAEITETLLVNRFKQLDDHYKLQPTQVDRSAYQALILESNSQIADSQISRCYEFFERKLKQAKAEIDQIKNVVTSRLSVVSIVLDKDDNPHLVFESLNAKGRPLTQADLIRNYFFMRVHVDEQEEVHTKYWRPMQDALKENLTEFIRHYLMRNGEFIKQGDVYFILKDRIGQNDALTALKELATFSSYYQKLTFPEHESSESISNALKRLNRFEVTTAYPFLLDCYHDYSAGVLPESSFVRILALVENFVVRRFVCSIPTSQLNKLFPSLYRQAKSKDPSNLVNGVSETLQVRGYPKDAEFSMRLRDSRLYGSGERAIKTKLILETIEASHNHKEQVPFDDLTIEHVMPQSITDWWKSHLGSDWQADHELLLHTIGNLTLTAYNSELSNDDYKKKQKRLANSHLELNHYFGSVHQWRKPDIETRSELLARQAVECWPYFGSNPGTTTASLDNITGTRPIEVKIMGQTHPVDSWRDVHAYTLETIADLEPEQFDKLATEYPSFIGVSPARFRTARAIPPKYFAESHLSAKQIYQFCLQCVESIGLTEDDWVVETERKD